MRILGLLGDGRPFARTDLSWEARNPSERSGAFPRGVADEWFGRHSTA
jgi:hypothetical protein